MCLDLRLHDMFTLMSFALRSYDMLMPHAHETTMFTMLVCTRLHVLAAAGLLDGLEATSHWSTYDMLLSTEKFELLEFFLSVCCSSTHSKFKKAPSIILQFSTILLLYDASKLEFCVMTQFKGKIFTVAEYLQGSTWRLYSQMRLLPNVFIC
ncbi:hypothetical protein O6H91_17G058900 [Diphasiastrum complanatum]|uniref:Uncharacterized protein n=1 Tax=Diphasiastrum complanatum TaxID=34168 RepID=A0ACC2B791_DIPCM|nr:hypothetical protein O6H91_17G058900 [Diphasiastrum complanatum]